MHAWCIKLMHIVPKPGDEHNGCGNQNYNTEYGQHKKQLKVKTRSIWWYESCLKGLNGYRISFCQNNCLDSFKAGKVKNEKNSKGILFSHSSYLIIFTSPLKKKPDVSKDTFLTLDLVMKNY